MTSEARRLLKALESSGMRSTSELGMTPTDLQRAITDLQNLFDDDGRAVNVLNTWHANDAIVGLELTQTGRVIARSV